MNSRRISVVFCCLVTLSATSLAAGDWPQWRGPNRDGKVKGFKAPTTWPKEMTKKWKITVGDGVATPALVGDRLYVFGRQAGQEVIRCLDADSGKEIWQQKYEAEDADRAAARFPVLGPRSSPTVAEGCVVTLGTRGTLTCLDAATGKLHWRKDDFHSWPRFFVSCSPLVVDGLCVAHLGGEQGAIVAYELTSGEEKWKWTGDGPCYGSPVRTTLGGAKVIVTPTANKLVVIDAANGRLLWETPYTQGRYNAATPIMDGQTLIYAGPTRGITAEKLASKAKSVSVEELWKNPDNSVMYNSPVVRKGLLFGLSNLNSLFCIDVESGKTKWNAPVSADARRQQDRNESRRGRRGRRGRGSGGYGSIVDAGQVLMALTPAAQLIVYRPSGQAFDEVARYKVASGDTYSYPIVSGNRIFIKDKDSVTLWTIE